jgi:methionyl-tRNA formyltransferase
MDRRTAARTVLICHHDAPLDRAVLARWLASTTNLVGVVVLEEPRQRWRKRVRREVRRVGPLRFMDVLAFQLYYRLFRRRQDRAWEAAQVAAGCAAYPALPPGLPVLTTHSPNSDAAREFIRRARPDLMIARCKALLREEIYSIPVNGTYVFHPGICPEYRNAHGCFWALASDDSENVGMTVLRIDAGVDTGPVYGYFRTDIDEVEESHFVIQQRVLFDNLSGVGELLQDVHSGRAVPLDTSGRASRAWGQPWLTSHLRWKRSARRRMRIARQFAPLS